MIWWLILVLGWCAWAAGNYLAACLIGILCIFFGEFE
jgi:hypothetical protein